jgi:hypothetical protein
VAELLPRRQISIHVYSRLVHTMWGVNVRTIRATFAAAGGKKLISVSEKAPRPGDWAIACDGAECVSSEFETSNTKNKVEFDFHLGRRSR